MTPDEAHAVQLLHRTLGSKDTDFAISENQDDGSPTGLRRGGVPLHSHRSEDEGWYVLSGKLRFLFGAREFEAPAGTAVLLPRGTPHTFWNPGPEPVRYLLIVRPKTAALLQALHSPDRPQSISRRDLYASFDVDLLE